MTCTFRFGPYLHYYLSISLLKSVFLPSARRIVECHTRRCKTLGTDQIFLGQNTRHEKTLGKLSTKEGTPRNQALWPCHSAKKNPLPSTSYCTQQRDSSLLSASPADTRQKRESLPSASQSTR